jgi:hypothetical protein
MTAEILLMAEWIFLYIYMKTLLQSNVKILICVYNFYYIFIIMPVVLIITTLTYGLNIFNIIKS